MPHGFSSSRLLLASTCLTFASIAIAHRAGAQQTPTWRIETSAGVIIDDYDIGLDGDRSALVGSMSVSHALGTQLRGVASLGFARVDDVSAFDPSTGYAERNDWIFATAGPQLDLALPRGSLVVALEAGAAWRRIASSGSIPVPREFGGGASKWSVVGAILVPSIHLRIPLATRLSLTGGARAYIINLPETTRTSPAFTLGLAFRP